MPGAKFNNSGQKKYEKYTIYTAEVTIFQRMLIGRWAQRISEEWALEATFGKKETSAALTCKTAEDFAQNVNVYILHFFKWVQ